jgi:TIR domain
MDYWLNMAIAIVGTAAGAAGAYFGYVAVRGHVRRRPATTAIVQQPGGPYDAFISYANADVDKAEWLANGLQARGLRVFLAKWVGVGLVEYAEKERALADSANGILLFSSATMSQPDIRDEYAALLQRVHSGARRFVPVLVDKTDLPPFARIRKPLDLIDRTNSQAALDELAQAIR